MRFLAMSFLLCGCFSILFSQSWLPVLIYLAQGPIWPSQHRFYMIHQLKCLHLMGSDFQCLNSKILTDKSDYQQYTGLTQLRVPFLTHQTHSRIVEDGHVDLSVVASTVAVVGTGNNKHSVTVYMVCLNQWPENFSTMTHRKKYIFFRFIPTFIYVLILEAVLLIICDILQYFLVSFFLYQFIPLNKNMLFLSHEIDFMLH